YLGRSRPLRLVAGAQAVRPGGIPSPVEAPAPSDTRPTHHQTQLKDDGTHRRRPVYIRAMTVSAEERREVAVAPDPAEAALIARARRQDTTAWELLVRAHEEHVFRL